MTKKNKTYEVNKMSDMIKRKLDEAKKNLAKLEKDANREPPKERKTKDMTMNVPEVPPDTFKPDENIPGFITAGPRMSKKWKQV